MTQLGDGFIRIGMDDVLFDRQSRSVVDSVDRVESGFESLARQGPAFESIVRSFEQGFGTVARAGEDAGRRLAGIDLNKALRTPIAEPIDETARYEAWGRQQEIAFRAAENAARRTAKAAARATIADTGMRDIQDDVVKMARETALRSQEAVNREGGLFLPRGGDAGVLATEKTLFQLIKIGGAVRLGFEAIGLTTSIVRGEWEEVATRVKALPFGLGSVASELENVLDLMTGWRTEAEEIEAATKRTLVYQQEFARLRLQRAEGRRAVDAAEQETDRRAALRGLSENERSIREAEFRRDDRMKEIEAELVRNRANAIPQGAALDTFIERSQRRADLAVEVPELQSQERRGLLNPYQRQDLRAMEQELELLRAELDGVVHARDEAVADAERQAEKLKGEALKQFEIDIADALKARNEAIDEFMDTTEDLLRSSRMSRHEDGGSVADRIAQRAKALDDAIESINEQLQSPSLDDEQRAGLLRRRQELRDERFAIVADEIRKDNERRSEAEKARQKERDREAEAAAAEQGRENSAALARRNKAIDARRRELESQRSVFEELQGIGIDDETRQRLQLEQRERDLRRRAREAGLGDDVQSQIGEAFARELRSLEESLKSPTRIGSVDDLFFRIQEQVFDKGTDDPARKTADNTTDMISKLDQQIAVAQQMREFLDQIATWGLGFGP